MPRSSAAPVMIALLPPVDSALSFAMGKSQPQPDSQPSNKASRPDLTRSEDLPKKSSAKPGSVVRKPSPNKPLSGVSHDRPEVKKPQAERLCMVPQDVISEQTPAWSAEAKSFVPVAGIAAAETSGTTLPADQTDGVASTGHSGSHELVDAIPDYSNNPLPEYPPLARQRHWQGVVWLLVEVSDEGLVETLHVERSCGHSVLDRAASRTVKRWRFTPARRAGVPAASQVRIPVRFRLEDS